MVLIFHLINRVYAKLSFLREKLSIFSINFHLKFSNQETGAKVRVYGTKADTREKVIG